MTIYVGAVGVLITLATGQSLEAATLMEIHVLKPDGTTATWTATKSETSGSIEYTTVDGDLDLAGYYALSAYVEWGESSTHLGEPCSLEVEAVPSVPAATWTYNSDSTTTRDQIRVMIGDTDSTDPLLNDSEIAQAYALEETVLKAAYLAAQWAAAKMAKDPDTNFDGISTKRSQRHAMMLETIERLKARLKSSGLNWSSAIPSSVDQTTDTQEFPTAFNPGSTGPIPWNEDDT